jgi:hypothetical protein
VRRELERVEIPGEHEARGRAWAIVSSAYAGRGPSPSRSPLPRVAAVAVALAALLAVALTPPGRAVLDEIRGVVGVERAQPALFSLPAPGSVLVTSDAGLWVVHENGSKRLLGRYREGGWSPLGRFVVAARRNELAALEPDGDVRWTLSRPGVRSPAWTGTETDTRIAYLDDTGIRVVAGDGTGDRLLVPGARGPIAWRPGAGFVLAHLGQNGRTVIRDVESGRVPARSARGAAPTRLVWSDDGERLLVIAPYSVRLLDRRGGLLAEEEPSDGTRVLTDAFRPGTRDVVEIRLAGTGSNVFRWADGRSLFRGTGSFRDLVWSPDGRWLLVTWPTADQWVFVRADGKRITAVADVSAQFRSRSFPRIEGWCCER